LAAPYGGTGGTDGTRVSGEPGGHAGPSGRPGRRSRGVQEPAHDAPRRIPPQDLEAEKAVLAAMLLDARAFHEVLAEVRAEDFYHPAHQTLFRAMVVLHDDQKPVDLITLSEYLTQKKSLDAVGGPVALAEIADCAATAAHVVHHARIVRDKAVKRRLIQVATEIAEVGYEETENADRLLDFAESRIFEVSKAQSRSTFQSLSGQIPPTFDYVEAIMNRGGDLTGLPTGFDDVDQMTGGLQPGELVIIAARPSMGKTAFALNIARNAAVDHGKKVALFSLEMTTRSLVIRLLSSEAAIDFSSLRKGFLPMADYRRLQDAADKLLRADIWIDDSGAATILEIKAKSRRLHAEHGLDLVVVDYLQLAHADGRRDRKDLEIAEISRGLKALAKELDIPVIALSQLNRGPEQRDPDKRRPMMGDLRESGAIEQDADVIGFIYRDVVYNKDTEDPHKAELIIEKQRNGPTGTVFLHFEGRYARFQNRSGREDGMQSPPFGGGFRGPDAGGSQGFGSGFDDEPVF
jgi:replicative DNA helicase